MSDDHSYQTISAYKHVLGKIAPTPNIDRLASEGMLFQKAFVENSLCTPARACLLTGLYSHQNGQRQLFEGIDTTKVFVSELLQKAGYQTAVVGKWHLRCNPKGFDVFHLLKGQGEYYNPVFRSDSSAGKFIREEGYATTLITDHALSFLGSRDKNKPFCLFVHHKAPHRNWMPETKYLDLYEDSVIFLPDNLNDDYSTRCSAAGTQSMSIEKDLEVIADLKVGELKDVPPYNEAFLSNTLFNELNRMTPAQREAWDKAYGHRNKKFIDQHLEGEELVKWKYQRYIKDYLRCVKSVDDGVGRITDYLDQQGLAENTLVIYTSDQGFYMGEHGWFDKRFMYEESFRTPLIVRFPKSIKAGSENNALVQNIDFAPTFLSIAGVAKPAEMTGTSLTTLFDGLTPPSWRTSLYYHYYDYPAFHNVRRHDGVRTDRYKLIHFYGKGGIAGATNPLQSDTTTAEYKFLKSYAATKQIGDDKDIDCNELYDLEVDPREMNNLFGKPGFEKIQADLQSRLENYRRELGVKEY